MDAFKAWLSSLPQRVKDNLIIVSDNPAFDIGTFNLMLSKQMGLGATDCFSSSTQVVRS